MKAIPNAGTYPARVNGKAVVYFADSGALCVALTIALHGSEVAWQGKHTITLVTADGTPNKNAIGNLMKCFPDFKPDGPEGFFWLEDNDLTQYDVEIVGEHKQYTPPGDNQEERTIFYIQWLNPPGGGFTMPESASRDDVKAKFGAKLRAMFGGKGGAAPAKAPATPAKGSAAPAKAPAAPPAKTAPKGPPSRKTGAGGTARTSTQEEVWAAIVAAPDNEGKSEDEVGAIYYAAMDEVAPDANGDLTPVQWGEVLNKLGL